MPISSNSVNWKSIGLHPLLVFEGFTHHLLDAEKLVRVGVDVLVFSGILQLPLTEGFNILRQVGGSKVIMAICWRYFLSSYVFCVIGDHFWAGKNHSSELRTCCATTIITYTRTKRYEKRDPFIPPVYHPTTIPKELLLTILMLNSSSSLTTAWGIMASLLPPSYNTLFREYTPKPPFP